MIGSKFSNDINVSTAIADCSLVSQLLKQQNGDFMFPTEESNVDFTNMPTFKSKRPKLNVNLHSNNNEKAKSEDEGNAFQTQTIVTKEKLRYLRYFRLVTHRKRNGKN